MSRNVVALEFVDRIEAALSSFCCCVGGGTYEYGNVRLWCNLQRYRNQTLDRVQEEMLVRYRRMRNREVTDKPRRAKSHVFAFSVKPRISV